MSLPESQSLAPIDSAKPKKPKEPFAPKEYKVVAIRECPAIDTLEVCDNPERAAAYWNAHIKTHTHFAPDREFFVVLFLNTRRKVKGHTLVSIGTLDTILVNPREVFRAAIIMGSAAIILMHCHPSGDPTPSEADIKVTRDMIRAGQLLKVEVIDHIIMGLASPERPQEYASLRELGFFYD